MLTVEALSLPQRCRALCSSLTHLHATTRPPGVPYGNLLRVIACAPRRRTLCIVLGRHGRSGASFATRDFLGSWRSLTEQTSLFVGARNVLLKFLPTFAPQLRHLSSETVFMGLGAAQ